MTNKIKNRNSGFISYIVLIIIAFIAAKYFFHFDIIEYLKSAQVHDFLKKVITWFGIFRGWVKTGYDWIYNWIHTMINHNLK